MSESGDANSLLAHAIDAELRDSTEVREWTREDLHTMPRLVSLCERLGVHAPDLLRRALVRVESTEDGHEPT